MEEEIQIEEGRAGVKRLGELGTTEVLESTWNPRVTGHVTGW